MLGKMLYLKWKDINAITVTIDKGVQVGEIVKFAASKFIIKDYMSEYQFDKKPNPEWVCNFVNSIIPQEFKENVDLRNKS